MVGRILLSVVCFLWTVAAFAQPATVVLAFDVWSTTPTIAFPMMQGKNLVGSYFNIPSKVGASSDYATKDQLVAMKAAGWEIGLYLMGPTGANIPTMYATSPASVNDLIKSGIDEMWSLGFNVQSVAPTQRAWLPAAKELARHSVTGVRVIDLSCWQTYPIPDPLYFRCGDTVSLGGSNTFASLKASVDSIPAGSIGIYILHMIGPVGDPYTLPTPVFDAWTTYLQSLVNSGTHRVVTFNDALKAP